VRRAHEINRLAIRTFARCLESGVWPGYEEVIHQLELPAWLDYEEDAILAGAKEGESDVEDS
jgi:hypothetical protein